MSATRVIDIHCHVMVPETEELVQSYPASQNDPFFRFSGSVSAAYNRSHFAEIVPMLTRPDLRLRDMDRMGIDVQAISITPTQFFYWTPPEVGAHAARIQNDRLAEIVGDRPDRFVGLATLPMQDVDLALAELERAVSLGFTGLEICSSVHGVDFDNRRFEPFFEEVVARDLLIVVHPEGFSHGERLSDHYLINTIGMPLDSTIFVGRMVFGGVLERFSSLKVCIVHGGGYIPSYTARFDHAWQVRQDCRRNIPRAPSSYVAQLYFDSMVFDTRELTYLVDRWGADHILLGTDYPYDMGETDPVALVSSVKSVNTESTARMLGGNAERLLRLDHGTQPT
jgi:aminocarboxymuconate-semialdehyde decarboxylase